MNVISYRKFYAIVKQRFKDTYQYLDEDVEKYFNEEDTRSIIRQYYSYYKKGLDFITIETVISCLDMCY